MKKADINRLKFLKKNSVTYFNTLKATDRKHTYEAKLEFSSYIDLIETIDVLLKVCIEEMVYGAEGASSRIKQDPNIQYILELVIQLLPKYEAELLDEIRPLLTAKENQPKEE